ncbi:hypothetical protein PspLS_06216 [Pyricularia sp. CBS 133598]|nr:hypothetical protein PspLS_06216 [Pyricularia sp. CBS 133598]
MRQHCTTPELQLVIVGDNDELTVLILARLSVFSSSNRYGTAKAIGSLDLGRNCVTPNKSQLLLRGPTILGIATKFAHDLALDQEQSKSGHCNFFHFICAR